MVPILLLLWMIIYVIFNFFILSNTLLFFNIKVFFGEQLRKFLTMPVNTAIWRHYDVRSVGNNEYIGGAIISEKTRPVPLPLHSSHRKLKKTGLDRVTICLSGFAKRYLSRRLNDLICWQRRPNFEMIFTAFWKHKNYEAHRKVPDKNRPIAYLP